MKKTEISTLPFSYTESLSSLLRGARIFDTSCSPEARVYYIQKDSGYYLKRTARGALARECEMTRYFHSLGLGAEVLSYEQTPDADFLLTAAMSGEDCTHSRFLENPMRLTDALAQTLLYLHSLHTVGCPIQDQTAEYIRTVEDLFRRGIFDPTFSPLKSITASDAFARFRALAPMLKSDTLLHGDFCLPNILLYPDFSLSGFIDLGGGGIGDRHIDLFWGAWTLQFNLGTDRYRERFFDAYGRDRIDEELLVAVALAECFR